jgi:hypothetical protein
MLHYYVSLEIVIKVVSNNEAVFFISSAVYIVVCHFITVLLELCIKVIVQ